MNNRVARIFVFVIAAAIAGLIVGATLHEVLRSDRPGDFLGWLGLGFTALGAAVASRRRIHGLIFFGLGGSLLVAYAAPTFSSAVPFGLLLLGVLIAPVGTVPRSHQVAGIIALWLFSLGVANGFNRNWAAGGPHMLLASVAEHASWQTLLAPARHLPADEFEPELFAGPFRLQTRSYRLFILASVIAPIIGAAMFAASRTRLLATILLSPALGLVAYLGWDPTLCAVIALGGLLVMVLPESMNARVRGIDTGMGSPLVGVALIALIVGWPHVQRYLTAEYDVHGRAYFAQNDHGAMSWPIEATLRVRRSDERPIPVDLEKFPKLERDIHLLTTASSRQGEFASRRPLARAFVAEFPQTPELQISTTRFYLDPKHQRISIRGRDLSFKPRNDGRYLRSSYRYVKEFPVDSVEGIEVPPL